MNVPPLLSWGSCVSYFLDLWIKVLSLRFRLISNNGVNNQSWNIESLSLLLSMRTSINPDYWNNYPRLSEIIWVKHLNSPKRFE